MTTTLPIAANSITAQYTGRHQLQRQHVDRGDSISVGTANDQWLNQVFEILLNRPITPAEIPYWNKQFAKGRSRYSIANEISTGQGGETLAVQDALTTTLGESGTPAELSPQ